VASTNDELARARAETGTTCDAVIQAGMVFAIEPGAYEGPGGHFGARFEKVVLVTASGPEVLSRFE